MLINSGRATKLEPADMDDAPPEQELQNDVNDVDDGCI